MVFFNGMVPGSLITLQWVPPTPMSMWAALMGLSRLFTNT